MGTVRSVMRWYGSASVRNGKQPARSYGVDWYKDQTSGHRQRALAASATGPKPGSARA